MFEIFREEWVVASFMFTFAGLSIFLRLLLGLLYLNMIKETDNMSATNNKLLKQCKLKFSNCYQLNGGVANISVFVDKFLNRMAFGPLTFEAMYHLSGQTMLLSVVSAGVGICRCILSGKMLGEILPFYIVSFVELYVYFSVSTLVDVRGKRRALKINLVDYLENHLQTRIGVTENDIEMLYGPQFIAGKRRRALGGDVPPRTVELMPIGGYSMQPALASGQQMSVGDTMGNMASPEWNAADAGRVSEEELEALLKEFLAN